MSAFNSYVVFDKEGYLIIDERETHSNPVDFFDGLSLSIQQQAHVMLVLREGEGVTRYTVVQPPEPPVPILGPAEPLRVV